MLLHDTSASHSLLSTAHLKNKMKFFTYVDNDYNYVLNYNDLHTARFVTRTVPNVECKFYDTYLFFPDSNYIFRGKRRLSFEEWWNEEIVTFNDGAKNNSITRKELILSESNQDGGAHFDRNINDIYDSYKKGNVGVIGQDITDPLLYDLLFGGYSLYKDSPSMEFKPKDITLALTR